ncbi:hypothetical protein IM792_04285 [Mucilaginibacter sp. JRF]|uniref:GTPase-associated system all-helical protein GASH n=1 Tax=Mucilaginibacter sp. JRF TaxID=2780088 RepID=UPI00187E4847|nr:GTPase-associated system all-helical protein GASH [Mucilaginibacter sp. JRF]MBE9583656.1 hypothetical protein [Mucilaginibacter sp. JRF]
MIQQLPKWYRIAAIADLKEEVLEKRSAAITNVATGKDYPLIYNCIRLFIGLPIKDNDFNEKLVAAIINTDIMFVDENVELEKRILAGAIVHESLQNAVVSTNIALSVNSAIFGINQETFINIDIIQTVLDYLGKAAQNARQPVARVLTPIKYTAPKEVDITDENYAVSFTSLATNFRQLLINSNNSLIRRLSVMEEESNIHWWLFRSFSSIAHKNASELSSIEAPIIFGLELSNLITLYPPPQNCSAFLEKMLSNVNPAGDNSSIKTYLDYAFDHEYGSELNDDIEKWGNLVPLHTAFSKIIENGSKDGWTNLFENSSAVKASDTFTPIEFAIQIFNERVLLNFNR